MGFARVPKVAGIGENTGDDYRFPDDKAARDYIIVTRGRTPEQLVRITTAGITGFSVAKVMAKLESAGWALGPHGPAAKEPPGLPDAAAVAFLRGPPETVATELLSVVTMAQQAVRALELLDELVPLARELRAFRERTPGASESLSSWRSELQMIAAFTHFAAEREGLELGDKEMEAFALIIGFRLPEEEFHRDPLTTRDRAQNWRRTLNRAEANGIIDVLRALADQVKSETPPTNA
ncbi:MAG: hypothetical protein IPO09_11670 [Anaeromyxobacter sp.]|nr:hypothetical protein [Anaeromyxobacter sp.]MBL0276250.1 hypothetical protein [Anaeromyxobacter sp.]